MLNTIVNDLPDKEMLLFKRDDKPEGSDPWKKWNRRVKIYDNPDPTAAMKEAKRYSDIGKLEQKDAWIRLSLRKQHGA